MIMKKFYLLCALGFAVLSSHAQGTAGNSLEGNAVEEPVGKHPITLNASVMLGANTVANHYISSHECTGMAYGAHIDFGRFYKRWENVSWNLSYDYISAFEVVGGLENAAQTLAETCTSWNLNYSSHYNWSFGDALMVKAGVGADFYADYMKALTNKTNNVVSVNMLAQLEASAAVSYIHRYDNWMLGLNGKVSIPFAGLAFTDSKHESGWGSLFPDGLMDSYDSHLKGTSFSNLQGFDMDLGVKFIMPRVAVNVGIASDNRWWYVNDIQNYRMSFMFKVGASFDLVSLEQKKTINRYF